MHERSDIEHKEKRTQEERAKSCKYQFFASPAASDTKAKERFNRPPYSTPKRKDKE